MVVLAREALHASVIDPVSASMNFLNEIAMRYPDAISLAAGRPFEAFHSAADIDKHIQVYLTHLRERGVSAAVSRDLLTQYGRTNGHIGDLIARTLDVDENIQVPAAAVMVTTGCQEAMVIALRGLCSGPDDVVLAAEPCYVGLTGAARILGVEVVGVPESDDGLRPETVRAVAAATRARGKNPKALYLVPNFANPSGISLPVPVRRALLAAAADEDLLILEDDPYGLFGLDDEPRPTLKSLDRDQRVIYLGSFAKSYFPGARVGFLVADQPVVDRAGRHTMLAEELSTIKSMLTVNTSALSQAVVGGMLIDAGFSLRAANQAKIAFYRQNLRTLLAALQRHFAGTAVRWNSPSGGFFVVCTVPVDASEELLEVSAQEYGVLWTPMRFFYVGGGGTHAIRLSCSAVEPPQIEDGVRRLAALLSR
ncbi:PLP-dependent aminotransferase family protein [Dactylosporangium sp. NPDC051541]|uniref:PLP-dependent aminotransferase family protein n=1 Tax=Dactylosporangium sp. NPDC051541 TaxID=3363977 RepID=UPI0037AFA002